MSEVKNDDLLLQSSHFAFGENWLDFSSKVDEQTVEQAVVHLRRLNGGDLTGKTFLDIGVGSGVHALAAHRLGARQVVGFDIDPQSVQAATQTLKVFAPEAGARFEVRSVFDATPESVGQFDVVYSWGVLHHTGDMYRAIRCAAALVAPGGELQIALYKKTPLCDTWRLIKRWYSHADAASQRRARSAYTAMHHMLFSLRGNDFEAFRAGYGEHRGMTYENDIHDWLGGYPYESIAPDECVEFMAGLGFEPTRQFIATPGRFLPGITGSGCDEFVFMRKVMH